MLRRLRWIKHALGGLILLPLALCAVEVGLRVHESFNGPIDDSETPMQTLLTDSPVAHHALAPFVSLTREDPSFAKSIQIETNSFGLRGPEPTIPKPLDTYRILCLGDDSVFGGEVELQECWTHRLQQYLQKRSQYRIEVINAGIPGYCPLLSYLQYKHHLVGLQPDLVILSFQMDDVADDHRYRRFTRQDEKGLPLACPGPGTSRVKRQPWEKLSRELLVVRRTQQWLGQKLHQDITDGTESADVIDTDRSDYKWLEAIPPTWEFSIKQSLMPIGQLRDLVRTTPAKLLLTLTPAPWQISPHASNGSDARVRAGVGESDFFPSRAPFDRILDYAKTNQIEAIDPSLEFIKFENPDRLFLDNYPRFSRLGHALFARELAYYLVEQTPGPWVKPEEYSSPLPVSQQPPRENRR